MKIRFKRKYFLLLCIKLVYTLYGVFVFGKISQLGDAAAYLVSPPSFSSDSLRSNTILMNTITWVLKKVLIFDIFVHIAFCIASYWGLRLILKQMKLSKANEYFLIILLCFPSFAMWTSVISKEALSCFFSCIVLAWIISILQNEKAPMPLLVNLIALYFSILLRGTVGLGLFLLIAALYFNKIRWINKYIRFFAIITGVIISFSIVYVFSQKYIRDSFIPLVEAYFDRRYYDSKTTRDFGFWKTATDLYTKSPQGIFIANLGPTLFESIERPSFLPYFFEGLIYICITGYFMLFTFFRQALRGVLQSNFVSTMIFGVFVILLLNYPFGVYNSGSALRYRSSYYHIIVILLFYFYNKERQKWKRPQHITAVSAG